MSFIRPRDVSDSVKGEVNAMVRECLGGTPMPLAWLASMPVDMGAQGELALKLVHDGRDDVLGEPCDHAEWMPFYEDEWRWMDEALAALERMLTGDDRDHRRKRELVAELVPLMSESDQRPPTEEEATRGMAIAREVMEISTRMMTRYGEWVRRTEQFGLTKRDKQRIAESATPTAKQFEHRVWTPCMTCYGVSPQALLRRARAGDAEAVEKLLAVDKAIVQDRQLAERIHRESANPKSAFMKAVRRGLAKRPPKLKAKRIKQRIAAQASALARDTDERVTNPQIRAALDAVARRRTGGADGDLPGSDDALRVCINRIRKDFDFDIPLPPGITEPKQ